MKLTQSFQKSSYPQNQKNSQNLKTSESIPCWLGLHLVLSSLIEAIPGWGARWKQVCPDRPRRKVPMSRPSQTEVAYVQTFVRSPDFHAFMSRLSCVHQTLARSCPDFRAFTRLSCVHVQTFVRSPDFRALNRFLCVHVQTFVRSTDFRAFMSRLSCVRQTFVRSCSDFRAFFDVSRLCNFERTTPPSCVHLRSGHSCFRLGPQPGIAALFEQSNIVILLCNNFTVFPFQNLTSTTRSLNCRADLDQWLITASISDLLLSAMVMDQKHTPIGWMLMSTHVLWNPW